MKPRHRAITVLALAFAIFGHGTATAQTAPTTSLTTAEAVAHLLFSPSTVAMPKTLGDGSVAYRGNRTAGGPQQTILSISASRAAPCLFDVFFAESLMPRPDGTDAVTTAYAATIDLRKLDQASKRRATAPRDGARLILRAKAFYCSRSMIMERRPELVYGEHCLDEVDEKIEAEDLLRMTRAFETLRRACPW
jgi:hypothetical protein